MLTRITLAIAAAVLASSASGALAQHWWGGDGMPAECVQARPYYTVLDHRPAPPRRLGCQVHGDNLPFAPF